MLEKQIEFRFLQDHHTPVAKILEDWEASLCLSQHEASVLEKNSTDVKPKACQRWVEVEQSLMQWMKVSSKEEQRGQRALGARF